MQNGYIGIIVLAVITSLIGAYYYFRIIIAMIFRENPTASTIEVSFIFKVVLLTTAILGIVIGLFPDLIIGLL